MKYSKKYVYGGGAALVVILLLLRLLKYYPFAYNTLNAEDPGRYTIGMIYDYEEGYEGKQPVIKYFVNGIEYKKRIRPGRRGKSPYIIYLDNLQKPHFVTGDYYFIKFSENDPEKSAVVISKRFLHDCLTKNYPTAGWESFPYEKQSCEKD